MLVSNGNICCLQTIYLKPWSSFKYWLVCVCESSLVINSKVNCIRFGICSSYSIWLLGKWRNWLSLLVPQVWRWVLGEASFQPFLRQRWGWGTQTSSPAALTCHSAAPSTWGPTSADQVLSSPTHSWAGWAEPSFAAEVSDLKWVAYSHIII